MNEKAVDSQKVTLRVNYDSSEALFASQALVQATAEEVFLDFSSGVVNDAKDSRVMRIHTRIAMTHAGATRLLNALLRTLRPDSNAKSEEP
jgi:Protein of unknown function (DUF3467)